MISIEAAQPDCLTCLHILYEEEKGLPPDEAGIRVRKTGLFCIKHQSEIPFNSKSCTEYQRHPHPLLHITLIKYKPACELCDYRDPFATELPPCTHIQCNQYQLMIIEKNNERMESIALRAAALGGYQLYNKH